MSPFSSRFTAAFSGQRAFNKISTEMSAAFVATATAGEIADLHRKWLKPKEVDPTPLIARRTGTSF